MDLNLKKITADRLEAGLLVNEFPEVYALQDIVLFNKTHDSNMFEHTLRSMNEMKDVLKKYERKHSKELNKIIGKYKKKEFLGLVMLLHDIGKKNTFKKAGKHSYCPDHEIEGELLSKVILSRFNFSKTAKLYVTDLVGLHKELFHIIHPMNTNLDDDVVNFKVLFKKYLPELYLIALADLKATDMKRLDKKRFEFIKNGFESLL